MRKVRVLGVNCFLFISVNGLPEPTKLISSMNGERLFHLPKRAKVPNKQFMNELPHIGELIRQELRRQGRSNVWLSEQIACNPRTISKIFKKQYIDTCQLWQISKALDYDFFKVYSELL